MSHKSRQKKRELSKAEYARHDDAVWRHSCPNCGARLGEYCRGPNGGKRDRLDVCAGRLAKVR